MASQAEIPNRGPGLLGGFMYGALGAVEQHAEEFRSSESARSLEEYRFAKEKELARFKEELEASRYARGVGDDIRKRGETVADDEKNQEQALELQAAQDAAAMERTKLTTEASVAAAQTRASDKEDKTGKTLTAVNTILSSEFGENWMDPMTGETPTSYPEMLAAVSSLDITPAKKRAIKQKLIEAAKNEEEWPRAKRSAFLMEFEDIFATGVAEPEATSGFTFKGKRKAGG